MYFRYKKIPILDHRVKEIVDYVYRPLIKIGIRKKANGKDEYIDYEALIDSGSDECIFPLDLVEVAGFTIDRNEGRKFRGLGEGVVIGYKKQVFLNLGGKSFKTEIYFSENLTGYGILGQRGFFDKFRIRFIYSKKRVEIIEEK